MDAATADAELRELFTRWLEAIPRRDLDFLDRTIDATWVYTDYTGQRRDKADYLQLVAGLISESHETQLREFESRLVSDELALAFGRYLSRGTLTNGGRVEQDSRFTALYARREGQWKALAHQATNVVEPFTSAPPEPAEQAIPRLHGEWYARVEASDVDWFAAVLHDDAVLTDNRAAVYTKPDYLERIRHTSDFEEARSTVERVNVEGQAAVATGSYRIRCRVEVDGGSELHDYTNRFTSVWRAAGDGWQLVALHASEQVDDG